MSGAHGWIFSREMRLDLSKPGDRHFCLEQISAVLGREGVLDFRQDPLQDHPCYVLWEPVSDTGFICVCARPKEWPQASIQVPGMDDVDLSDPEHELVALGLLLEHLFSGVRRAT